MKATLIVLLCVTQISFSQPSNSPNIFIITTDGFRWQEVFEGADSAILFNPKYVEDTATFRDMYWANTAEERRQRLMPFLWNYVSRKGQLWGNRNYQNNVSVTNTYKISYPGYNEILTGFTDPSVSSNKQHLNTNSNLLDYLNTYTPYKDSIAAFASWKLFDYILNKSTTNIPLNCGYQLAENDSLTNTEQVVNSLQTASAYNKDATRRDLLTFTLATEYIQKKHPKVMYLGFGETDEFAHKGRYDLYLNQANMIDKFLAELWNITQSDNFYKNNTIFFVTTDHGRGNKSSTWNKHGFWTRGSKQTWLAQFGLNIKSLGEVKESATIHAIEFAQTVASYLGEDFSADHPISNASETLLSLLDEKR